MDRPLKKWDLGVSQLMAQRGGQSLRRIRASKRDQRLYVEPTIYWSWRNRQTIISLFDVGAKVSTFFGDPSRFLGTFAIIEGYEGKVIPVTQMWLKLGVGCIPPQEYEVSIAPIQEYILGIDILSLLCKPFARICLFIITNFAIFSMFLRSLEFVINHWTTFGLICCLNLPLGRYTKPFPPITGASHLDASWGS